MCVVPIKDLYDGVHRRLVVITAPTAQVLVTLHILLLFILLLCDCYPLTLTSGMSPISSFSIHLLLRHHSPPAAPLTKSPFSSCSYFCYETILLLLLLLINHYCPPEASLSPWPARKDILRWCTLIGEQLSVPVTDNTADFYSHFIFREKNSTCWCFDGHICIYRICPFMLFWGTIEHIREKNVKLIL